MSEEQLSEYFGLNSHANELIKYLESGEDIDPMLRQQLLKALDSKSLDVNEGG